MTGPYDIPEDATSGDISILTGGIISNAVNFNVINPTPPHMISMTPSEAVPEERVEISGRNFGTSKGENQVFFNGIKAYHFALWSDTIIRVFVPQEAWSGDVQVLSGGVLSNSMHFTVTNPIVPHITSLDPDQGMPGALFEIEGVNFGTNPEKSDRIYLNNYDVNEIDLWSDTLIKAHVPDQATSGEVEVITSSGTSNGIYFTVLHYPVVIDRIRPIQGGIYY